MKDELGWLGQDKYDGPLITQLREPMITLLQRGNSIDLEHEAEDEADAAQRATDLSEAAATKNAPASTY